jgi:hypothetical protein
VILVLPMSELSATAAPRLIAACSMGRVTTASCIIDTLESSQTLSAGSMQLIDLTIGSFVCPDKVLFRVTSTCITLSAGSAADTCWARLHSFAQRKRCGASDPAKRHLRRSVVKTGKLRPRIHATQRNAAAIRCLFRRSLLLQVGLVCAF